MPQIAVVAVVGHGLWEARDYDSTWGNGWIPVDGDDGGAHGIINGTPTPLQNVKL
jgi:hypothetical protein